MGDFMGAERKKGVIPLNRLPIDSSALISGISEKAAEKTELLVNTGFVPGERVTPLFTSPAGDPTAYLLGGCFTVALRHAEAENILVTEESYEDRTI